VTAVVGALAGRSIRQTFRRPQFIAPILLMPTLFLAVNTGGAESARSLTGFPDVAGFLDFELAGAMMQSAMLAGVAGAIALAIDIEMGFTDRLFAAPISRFAIVLGRLTGVAVLGAACAVWFIAVGLIFDASFVAGVPGMLVIIGLTALTSVAFGGISAAIALYTGTSSVVQGLFPLLFVVLFLSSAFFPANLLIEPAASIADYNPLSFIADGIREPVISSLTLGSVAEALGAIALVGAISTGLSAIALRRRLRVG